MSSLFGDDCTLDLHRFKHFGRIHPSAWRLHQGFVDHKLQRFERFSCRMFFGVDKYKPVRTWDIKMPSLKYR